MSYRTDKGLKEIEWINGNKMKIETGHKTFDQQTNIISYGNIIANTMVGFYIRAYNDTVNPVGQTRPLGYLQDFDLQNWRNELYRYRLMNKVKAHLVNRAGILYRLFHYNKNQRIIHGFILTDTDYNLIEKWVVGPTYKSWDVVLGCEPYLARERTDESQR